MRKLYAQRRDATAEGLETALGKYMHIERQPGGMHLILRFKGRMADRPFVTRMLAEGLYAEALTDWAIEMRITPGLLLNFTNVESRKAAESLGRRLLKLL